jgi:hypothetical protein
MDTKGGSMTDDFHYKLVEEFANKHSMAMGGGIKVNCTSHHTSFTPDYMANPYAMKYEDVNYLKSQMDGACSFLFFLRREGYEIKKVNKKKSR